MILDYKPVVIENKEYMYTISPIIKIKTKIAFVKPGTNFTALLYCMEEDTVETNIGFADEELSDIYNWIDKNRISLWNEAQNKPIPSRETLTDIINAAKHDLDSITDTPGLESMSILTMLSNAVMEELNNREELGG